MPSHATKYYYFFAIEIQEITLDKHDGRHGFFQILTSSQFIVILVSHSSRLASAVQEPKQVVKSHNNNTYNTTDQQDNLSCPQNNLLNDAVTYQQNSSAGDSVNYYILNMLPMFQFRICFTDGISELGNAIAKQRKLPVCSCHKK
jgi:hypothetical protein